MSSADWKLSPLPHDPRVIEARRLIREALLEHTTPISGVRPPDSSREMAYKQAIEHFSQDRGGKLFYPYLGSGIGNGPFVELADGSVKYDMITGIGVHVFGHNDPQLVDAGIEAALSDAVMQGNLQQGVEPLLFSRELIEAARESGAPVQHCFLSTSGATANENALKLLFQARFPADRILAFRNGFAGRTLVLSQVTDRPQNRDGMPTTLAVDYVPFFDPDRPQASTAAALDTLSEHLERYPQKHAGMIFELIQGEGGYYAAPREFFLTLIDALRRRDVPVFFDEIQTFGRTTRLFAFQHLALDEFADVVTVGKMTQVCATLFSDRFVPKPGLISQTFTGATSSIVAARCILRRLREGGFFGAGGRIAQIHARFVQHLEGLAGEHPEAIRGPWGVGGMIAFTPYDGDARRAGAFVQALFQAGVIAFLAGDNPKRVRMLPPLGAITDEQIDAVCGIIRQVLTTPSA